MLVISGVATKLAPCPAASRISVRGLGEIAGHVAARAHLDEGGADHWACSSGSSWPRRSSSWMSSDPPTCCFADEDLRHGVAAVGAQHHLLAQRAVLHVDLLEGDALLLQQRLGGMAVRAIGRGVDRDFRPMMRSNMRLRRELDKGEGHEVHLRAPRPSSAPARRPPPWPRWCARRRPAARICPPPRRACRAAPRRHCGHSAAAPPGPAPPGRGCAGRGPARQAATACRTGPRWLGQQGRLVEAPLPQPEPVQRHGHDHIRLGQRAAARPAPSCAPSGGPPPAGRGISARGRASPPRPRTARRRGRGPRRAGRRGPRPTVPPRPGHRRRAFPAHRRPAPR